jgi:hypothetical protein
MGLISHSKWPFCSWGFSPKSRVSHSSMASELAEQEVDKVLDRSIFCHTYPES